MHKRSFIASSGGNSRLPAGGPPELSLLSERESDLPAGAEALMEQQQQQQKQQQQQHTLATAAAAAATEQRQAATAVSSARSALLEFSLTPRLVKAHLDAHVIGQDAAKRALAVAVCDHYTLRAAAWRTRRWRRRTTSSRTY